MLAVFTFHLQTVVHSPEWKKRVWIRRSALFRRLLPRGRFLADLIFYNLACFRWVMVAICGTLLSVISLVSNILIARVLLQRKYSNFFFLGLLALSDVFLSVCYFPVIAMEVVRYSIGVSGF